MTHYCPNCEALAQKLERSIQRKDKPDAPGLWVVCVGNLDPYIRPVDIYEIDSPTWRKDVPLRWYGPIPEDVNE